MHLGSFKQKLTYAETKFNADTNMTAYLQKIQKSSLGNILIFYIFPYFFFFILCPCTNLVIVYFKCVCRMCMSCCRVQVLLYSSSLFAADIVLWCILWLCIFLTSIPISCTLSYPSVGKKIKRKSYLQFFFHFEQSGIFQSILRLEGCSLPNYRSTSDYVI